MRSSLALVEHVSVGSKIASFSSFPDAVCDRSLITVNSSRANDLSLSGYAAIQPTRATEARAVPVPGYHLRTTCSA